MLNMKKTTAIVICSVLATSNILSCPAYAESVGAISLSATIKDSPGFNGEVYVILADMNGNQKLALLKSSNNYQYKLDNLKYASYEIKDIHVYNTYDEFAKDRKEMIADFTTDSGDLNLNEANKNSNIIITINSLKTDEKSEIDTNSDTDTDKEINKEDNVNNEDVKQSEEESTNKGINKFLEARKGINIFNFILDSILIIGLGSIWFFKVRGKKDKDEE